LGGIKKPEEECVGRVPRLTHRHQDRYFTEATTERQLQGGKKKIMRVWIERDIDIKEHRIETAIGVTIQHKCETEPKRGKNTARGEKFN